METHLSYSCVWCYDTQTNDIQLNCTWHSSFVLSSVVLSSVVAPRFLSFLDIATINIFKILNLKVSDYIFLPKQGKVFAAQVWKIFRASPDRNFVVRGQILFQRCHVQWKNFPA